ncbi:carboxymuconolactone decarboxylase family protein [Streptomyces sp. HSW2009]|uniref:carboxymuconolactone decarboxylase family protein n=1 Tax=Streptomyces sp. HSW2009 TaxID=3142890 RepID=UPI0032EF5934
MDARLNFFASPQAMASVKHLIAAGKVFADGPLPTATRELVLLRVSQINGCARCVEMHTKEAEHEGESSARLHLVATWREATLFTPAERAALELAEEGTRIADAAGGVSDEVWAEAAKHYTEAELIALTGIIAVTNAFNRLNLITQQPAGDYVVGQYAHLS